MYVTLLKLLMAAMAINIVLTPWKTPLVKVAGYAMTLLSYFLPMVAIKQEGTHKVPVTTLCVIGMGGLIIASLMSNSTGIGFDLVKDILAFICMYWAIDVQEQTHTRRDLNHIFGINKLLSLIYIAYTFLPFPFRYTLANEWGYYAFTLSMGNTNSTSIYMMFSIMLLVIEFSQSHNKFHQFILLVMSVCLMYTIVLLKSRMILVCGALTVFFIFLGNIKLKKWYANIAVLIPIAFILLQMGMGAIGEIRIMGKPLASGRQDMFAEYLELMGNDPWSYILGQVGQHKLSNYHNAPFAILMNLGILGYICYLVFWCSTLRHEIGKKNQTSIHTIAIMCLFVFLIHSSSEAAPMIGMMRYGVPIIIISRLAKDTFR